LEERRNLADLIELFKMVRGISTVPLQIFFKLADESITRGHRWKLVKEYSRRNARLHFFSVSSESLEQSVIVSRLQLKPTQSIASRIKLRS